MLLSNQVRVRSPTLPVSATIAKKRRIRHVDIPQNAVAWMSLIAEKQGKIAPLNFGRKWLRLRRKAKFGEEDEAGNWKSKWDENSLRHSFASYHYALYGDPLLTSRLLGHRGGDDVLFAHYRRLATKQEAGQFFALSPSKSGATIVPLERNEKATNAF